MKCCHGRKKVEVKALSMMTIFDQQVDDNTLFVYDFPIDATTDALVELERQKGSEIGDSYSCRKLSTKENNDLTLLVLIVHISALLSFQYKLAPGIFCLPTKFLFKIEKLFLQFESAIIYPVFFLSPFMETNLAVKCKR